VELTGIITETEAYRGKDDRASHAATKMTDRNRGMYGTVGRSYVYFTYGMYFMFNVVAKSKKQDAGAVLIRGIYPQNGIKIMTKNRGMKDVNEITNGPGKLTMAMNISIKENNIDLTKKSSIYISEGMTPKKIKKLPRVGISKAIDKKWNFSINPKNYF
jgi:DNA-3-methyladenine glycosylase